MNDTSYTLNILETDSADYNILFDAAMSIKGVPGFTCEIGIRRGGGSTIIMSALIENNDKRPHVGLDPYGNIDYRCGDKVEKFDYTNQMKILALAEIYSWCYANGVEFLFFNMEDTEFFSRYSDGIPIYNEKKYIVNQYALVHFDGPHYTEAVQKEVDFFATRTPKGGMWVFDDVTMYDHNSIEKNVLSLGFEKVGISKCKLSYRKL